MRPLLTLLGILKWPATVAAAIFVFATSTQASLSLLSEHFSRGASASATIEADVTRPVIRMPDTPTVTPAVARANATAVPDGRRFALAATGNPSRAPDQGLAQMVASTGLIVRARPQKASAAMGSISRGTTVGVRARHGGWLLVDGPGTLTGWVYGKYLTPGAGR
jgi:hypothetical protein